MPAFTREYVEELRREGQRKGERIRMLTEALAAKTADYETEKANLQAMMETYMGEQIKRELAGREPVTANDIKQACLAVFARLSNPYPTSIITRDPADPSRVLISIQG